MWNAVLWELALQTCSSEFVLYLFFIFYLILFFYFFIFFLCFLFISFFLSVFLSLSLSTYLSLSQLWCLSLSRCIKKKKKKRGKGGEKIIYLFIYFYFLFFCSVWRHFWPACAYAWARMVRSGLLLLTRSRWNAVRCYGIQFVYQCQPITDVPLRVA